MTVSLSADLYVRYSTVLHDHALRHALRACSFCEPLPIRLMHCQFEQH